MKSRSSVGITKLSRNRIMVDTVNKIQFFELPIVSLGEMFSFDIVAIKDLN